MVIIGANQDTLFARLAKMMGTDWADDPRYATHDARGENQAELDAMISVWTRNHSMAEVLRQCEAHAIPSGPVNTAKEMLVDAHIKAREAIVRVFSPLVGGEVPMQAALPKLERSRPAAWSALARNLEKIRVQFSTSLGLQRGRPSDRLRAENVI